MDSKTSETPVKTDPCMPSTVGETSEASRTSTVILVKKAAAQVSHSTHVSSCGRQQRKTKRMRDRSVSTMKSSKKALEIRLKKKIGKRKCLGVRKQRSDAGISRIKKDLSFAGTRTRKVAARNASDIFSKLNGGTESEFTWSGLTNPFQFTTACAPDASLFPFKCQSCHVLCFATYEDLREHEDWCGRAVPGSSHILHCFSCGCMYRVPTVLTRHINEVHKSSDHDQTAKITVSTGRNPYNFSTTFAPDYSDFPKVCPSCSVLRFRTNSDLFLHEDWCGLSATPGLGFGCPMCPRFFKRADLLQRHVRRRRCLLYASELNKVNQKSDAAMTRVPKHDHCPTSVAPNATKDTATKNTAVLASIDATAAVETNRANSDSDGNSVTSVDRGPVVCKTDPDIAAHSSSYDPTVNSGHSSSDDGIKADVTSSHTCPVCDVHLPTIKELLQHFQIAHRLFMTDMRQGYIGRIFPARDVQCLDCFKTFKSRLLLQRHKILCHKVMHPMKSTSCTSSSLQQPSSSDDGRIENVERNRTDKAISLKSKDSGKFSTFDDLLQMIGQTVGAVNTDSHATTKKDMAKNGGGSNTSHLKTSRIVLNSQQLQKLLDCSTTKKLMLKTNFKPGSKVVVLNTNAASASATSFAAGPSSGSSKTVSRPMSTSPHDAPPVSDVSSQKATEKHLQTVAENSIKDDGGSELDVVGDTDCNTVDTLDGSKTLVVTSNVTNKSVPTGSATAKTSILKAIPKKPVKNAATKRATGTTSSAKLKPNKLQPFNTTAVSKSLRSAVSTTASNGAAAAAKSIVTKVVPKRPVKNMCTNVTSAPDLARNIMIKSDKGVVSVLKNTPKQKTTSNTSEAGKEITVKVENMEVTIERIYEATRKRKAATENKDVPSKKVSKLPPSTMEMPVVPKVEEGKEQRHDPELSTLSAASQGFLLGALNLVPIKDSKDASSANSKPGHTYRTRSTSRMAVVGRTTRAAIGKQGCCMQNCISAGCCTGTSKNKSVPEKKVPASATETNLRRIHPSSGPPITRSSGKIEPAGQRNVKKNEPSPKKNAEVVAKKTDLSVKKAAQTVKPLKTLEPVDKNTVRCVACGKVLRTIQQITRHSCGQQ